MRCLAKTQTSEERILETKTQSAKLNKVGNPRGQNPDLRRKNSMVLATRTQKKLEIQRPKPRPQVPLRSSPPLGQVSNRPIFYSSGSAGSTARLTRGPASAIATCFVCGGVAVVIPILLRDPRKDATLLSPNCPQRPFNLAWSYSSLGKSKCM